MTNETENTSDSLEHVNPSDKQPETESTQSASADSVDLIQKANEAAERLEKGNKDLAELIKKQQELQVKATLAGQATAGQKEISKDEKEIADAKKMLEGTGLEDHAFPKEKA